MIRTLLFSHSVFAPTGTAQSSQDMLNGLLSNGCAVTFVTLEAKNKELIYSVNFENEKKLTWITYLKSQNLLNWRNHFFQWLRFKLVKIKSQWYSKIVIENTAWDLIIVNGIGSYFMFENYNYNSSSRKILCFRESPEIFKFSKHHSEEWLNSILFHFDNFLFVAKTVREKWEFQLNIDHSKTYLIENTIREDIADILLKKDIKQLRREFNLPLDKKIIICNASIQYHKGQDLLLSVFKSLNKEFDDLHLLILGSLSAGGEFVNKILSEFKLFANITFFNPLPTKQALSLVYLSDILVLPSRTEAMPRVILEAMALKKVIIASDAGGIPDLIKSGRNGILFNVNDEMDFTSKFLCLLREEQKWQDYSLAAHSDFKAYFSRSIQEKKWKVLLNSLSSKN